MKYPSVSSAGDVRVRDLHNYIQAFEELLYAGDNRCLDFIDIDSFVAWLLVKDILGDADSLGSNQYYYLSEDISTGSKIKMGPGWDFDGAFFSVDDWSLQHSDIWAIFFPFLLRIEGFQDRYLQKWEEIRRDLPEKMEAKLRVLYASYGAALEDGIWKDSSRRGIECISEAEQMENCIQWFYDRCKWIDEHLYLIKEPSLQISVSSDCKTMNIHYRDDGYSFVQFPSWSEVDGQDDLVWYDAVLEETGYWSCEVDLRDGHSRGFYNVHVYAEKNAEYGIVDSSIVYVW